MAALTVTGDPDEADEVTQEAFIRLFDSLGRLKEPKAVSGWLTRTAANIARDRRRFTRIRGWLGAGRKAPEAQPDRAPSPEALAARREMEDVVARWSEANLTDSQRLVVQLRVGEEMTFEEIAAELGISASAAKTHFARAREKLKVLAGRLRAGDDYE